MKAKILTIAGSDSGGGAGIQADIKTAEAFGVYSMTAITAITSQNTQGVSAIHPIPPKDVATQIDAVLSDFGADVIKTGMLYDAAIINIVAERIQLHAAHIPLIIDPVMVAKGGAILLEDEAINALTTRLLPRCTLITPNIPEAEQLTGKTITSSEDMESAALFIMTHYGAGAVLLKGGHLAGNEITDILVDKERTHRFTHARITTRHTHGTGCTLSTAIACGIASGLSLKDAVIQARHYVLEAIRHAPEMGQGQGPLCHRHLYLADT